MKKTILILLLGMQSILHLNAQEINFSGFTTVAGGITFDDDQSLEGYDDQFSFNPNSLIGLQISSDLGNGWGVTTQFVARGSNEWALDAEWAYISYDVNDDWRLLFGRQRAPFYMYSDFLDVSYAYHWIAPPGGVYSVPFDVFDGVGSIYTNTIGDFDSTLHLVYGRNTNDAIFFGEPTKSDFSDFFSGSWTLTQDWFTLRASFARTELDIQLVPLQPLLDGWRATGVFADVADSLEIKGEIGNFSGVGFTIDYEDYFVVGEYTQIRPQENVFPDQDSYYISFGKRFDDFTLHLTYGADEDTADLSVLNGVPPGVSPGVDFLLVSTTGLLLSTEEDSSFITLGLRWEISSSVAFKVEYTDYSDDRFVGNDAELLQFAITTVF